MKIRRGFVSNSSSSSFLIQVDEGDKKIKIEIPISAFLHRKDIKSKKDFLDLYKDSIYDMYDEIPIIEGLSEEEVIEDLLSKEYEKELKFISSKINCFKKIYQVESENSLDDVSAILSILYKNNKKRYIKNHILDIQ